MARLSFLMTIWAFAGLGSAAVCLENVTRLPDGWEVLDEMPDPSTPMRISIALSLPNIHLLSSKIVSGSILSQEEARNFREPLRKDVDNVNKWLSHANITEAKTDQDWIYATTTVGAVERLLETKLRRYSFDGRKAIIRTTEYHVPDDIASAIDFVHPVANFMKPEHKVSPAPDSPHLEGRQQPNGPCGRVITTNCIRDLYNIKYIAPNVKSPALFGVAGFLEQWASFSDLEQNFAQSRHDLLHKYNFSVEYVNGGENRQGLGMAGIEANLDIQYAMAIAFPAKVVYYTVGGRAEKLDVFGAPVDGDVDDNEPYLDLFRHITYKPNKQLPNVLSISYADDEYSVPRAYATRVCHEIGILAVRGVTVLSGSGDGGARGGRNATCRSRDGLQDETISTFPASCPWVTAVGAVDNSENPPRAAEFSSGGFSNYFLLPHWQKEAVKGYVGALHGHLKGHYNPHMRAVPDISAVGTLFETVVNGRAVMLQGTSASTPVVAAMLALINDDRLRRGKGPLGWLNGRLYTAKVRNVLQDITTGESLSCVFSDGRMPGGWPAAVGYDTVTGLGVPSDFEKLREVLL